MVYFKINNIDFSKYVSGLKVKTDSNYTAQTNAAGNTVIDYINKKRTITVSIIPLDNVAMLTLQQAINNLSVAISFQNPQTNILEESVLCMLPSNEIEFYTIQDKKVMYKTYTLQFTEL